MKVCDICSDPIKPGSIHYCPLVDDRYDSAELLPIRLEYYQDHP